MGARTNKHFPHAQRCATHACTERNPFTLPDPQDTFGSGPLAAIHKPPARTKGRHNSDSTRVSATARATARSKVSRSSSRRPPSSALLHTTLTFCTP
eukprot:222229-Pelagomonas_calceolata.AAC.1